MCRAACRAQLSAAVACSMIVSLSASSPMTPRVAAVDVAGWYGSWSVKVVSRVMSCCLCVCFSVLYIGEGASRVTCLHAWTVGSTGPTVADYRLPRLDAPSSRSRATDAKRCDEQPCRTRRTLLSSSALVTRRRPQPPHRLHTS